MQIIRRTPNHEYDLCSPDFNQTHRGQDLVTEFLNPNGYIETALEGFRDKESLISPSSYFVYISSSGTYICPLLSPVRLVQFRSKHAAEEHGSSYIVRLLLLCQFPPLLR